MFRFSIRDVLWLMLVVGLGVGWWLDRGKLSTALIDARSRQAIAEQEKSQAESNLRTRTESHNEVVRAVLDHGWSVVQRADGTITFAPFNIDAPRSPGTRP